MDFSNISVVTLSGMYCYNERQSVRLWFRNQGLDVLSLQEEHVDSGGLLYVRGVPAVFPHFTRLEAGLRSRRVVFSSQHLAMDENWSHLSSRTESLLTALSHIRLSAVVKCKRAVPCL